MQALHSALSSIHTSEERIIQLKLDLETKQQAIARLKRNDHSTNAPPPIRLGVCAMKKKVSKPLKEILARLPLSEFTIVIFDQRMLIEDRIETWPVVDCLITFYSLGFPLDKALAYIDFRRPFLINDLKSQSLLWDRRNIYRVCAKYHIPVPKHIFVNRDDVDGLPDDELEEGEDWVEVKGKGRIYKPFVEKPVDADDHCVRIYYPRSSGGGCKELFRKVGDRSSEFYPDRDRVRKEGSYIYEEFLPTEGTDVKVYAVTGDYAHAEARKSPVMDGRVVRDDGGVEVRYPIILNHEEKNLCRKVVEAFGQRVCGFDMLRSGGKAYVCDINGWSFVKRSTRYHKDAALMLARLMRSACHRPEPALELPLEDLESGSTSSLAHHPKRRHEELRAVVAIVRHGDRTPKQKLKLKVTHERFLSLLPPKCKVDDELKFKTSAELGNILSIINDMILAAAPRAATPVMDGAVIDEEQEEEDEAMYQARAVLEMHGSFKGINRKVQLKCTKLSEDGSQVLEAQLVIKWGGVLTTVGREHAEQMGRSFRERLYPGTDGLLRLHSTYRHDLKIYSSDEGRVQVTAAAFAKGLLDLEGHLTPILVSLIRKDGEVNKLLDDTSLASRQLEKAKQKVKALLASTEPVGPVPISVQVAREALGDPVTAMTALHGHIKNLAGQLRSLVRQLRAITRPERFSVVAAVPTRRSTFQRSASTEPMYTDVLEGSEGGSAAASLGQPDTHVDRGDGAVSKSDAIQLAFARWEKLAKDFYRPKTNSFDASKIPDIYDCVKFDIMHTPELFSLKQRYLLKIFPLAKKLADIVVPQEYGLDPKDKLELGALACHELLRKLRDDLKAATGDEGTIEDDTGDAGSDPSHSRRVSDTSLMSLDKPQAVSPKTASPRDKDNRKTASFEQEDSGSVVSGVSGLPPIKIMSTSKEETQHRLDKKMAKDLGIKSSDRHVRTRLYFTSESHMHSMLNVLRFAHLADESLPSPSRSSLIKLEETEELGYLSSIVFRLFEVANESGQKRFSLRVAFSPGVPLIVPIGDDGELFGPIIVGNNPPTGETQSFVRLANELPPASPFISLWSDLDLDQALHLLDKMVARFQGGSSSTEHKKPGMLARAFSNVEMDAERPFSRGD